MADPNQNAFLLSLLPLIESETDTDLLLALLLLILNLM